MGSTFFFAKTMIKTLLGLILGSYTEWDRDQTYQEKICYFNWPKNWHQNIIPRE